MDPFIVETNFIVKKGKEKWNNLLYYLLRRKYLQVRAIVMHGVNKSLYFSFFVVHRKAHVELTVKLVHNHCSHSQIHSKLAEQMSK